MDLRNMKIIIKNMLKKRKSNVKMKREEEKLY